MQSNSSRLKPPSKPIGRQQNVTATKDESTDDFKLSSTNLSTKRKQETSNTRATRAKLETKKEPLKSSSNTTAVTFKASAELKTTKRAAWDVKGRLQDLEAQHLKTLERLTSSTEALNSTNVSLGERDAKIEVLSADKEMLESKLTLTNEQLNELQCKLEEANQQLQLTSLANENQILQLTTQHSMLLETKESKNKELERKLDDATNDLNQLKSQIKEIENTLNLATQSNTSIEGILKLKELKLESTLATILAKDAQIEDLESKLATSLDNCNVLENQVREGEMIRRKLHNTIQELKGNIRVFCRVRPMMADEEKQIAAQPNEYSIALPDEKTIQVEQSLVSADGMRSGSKPYPFQFDKVFGPSSTQPVVFEEISQLVQSALDGYNVCIFAYGQTGSGKTFTMEGPSQSSQSQQDEVQQMGMIPRAVHQIFQSAKALEEKGWKYQMEAQYVEIYNETIRDLLVANGGEQRKHEIKHDAKSCKTCVTDIVTHNVTSPMQVHELLKRASTNRAVASTNCNERSSRSHSVFTLRLEGVNETTLEKCSGDLNLIDLAGSERLSSSGSTGDRLKETQAINKSLSSLGDVIFSLANKDQHIPYRNSKLTFLLQNSLGGNSKTLMFVNVSPMPTSAQETLCSLRFATKVNSCQIGTAKRNNKT